MDQTIPQATDGPFEAFSPLPDSLMQVPKAFCMGDIDPHTEIELSLKLKNEKSLDEAVVSGLRLSIEEFELEYGLPESQIAKFTLFAQLFGFTILDIDKVSRIAKLKGSLCLCKVAFGVTLHLYRDHWGRTFRARTGRLYIPAIMADSIEGIYGLDERDQISSRSKTIHSNYWHNRFSSRSKGYTGRMVAELYRFPLNYTGAKQTIGFIQLGGGYRQTDIDQYFADNCMKAPQVFAKYTSNVANTPSLCSVADNEIAMDLQIAGSVAPDAKHVVYFAPNSSKGFMDVIAAAIFDKEHRPSVLCICWGATEMRWNSQLMNAINDYFKIACILGITVCVASGDAGSSNGVRDGKVHVDFPASSPYVLSCGGTKLITLEKRILSEVVWNESEYAATGGGISEHFPVPFYQQGANVPASKNRNQFNGRGVPDIAGHASMQSGYRILVNGRYVLLGGTSAASALYAGLIAILNEQRGIPHGFINPTLYANPQIFRKITYGNNITTSTRLGYSAASGWNACTGLGILSNLPSAE